MQPTAAGYKKVHSCCTHTLLTDVLQYHPKYFAICNAFQNKGVLKKKQTHCLRATLKNISSILGLFSEDSALNMF